MIEKRSTQLRALALVVGVVLYMAILWFLRQPYNLTLAPLIAGIITGYVAGTGREAFLYGLIAGAVSIALLLNTSVIYAFEIVAGIGGAPVALLALLYHLLTPGFIAATTRYMLLE
ncbi:MAG: hypothetical protein F7C37_01065 [Desulfurococcales archaeon]|nr:hypothetical protein [Desulfurococcales archaeon]